MSTNDEAEHKSQPTNARSTDSKATVSACPHCDTTGDFHAVTGKPGGAAAKNPDDDYYCKACGESFDDPVERDRQHVSTVTGSARVLDRMDPDALDDVLGGDA